MKKHRTTRSRPRRLFLEGLETRAMLAGNVTASVSGGTLFVTGDNADNEVVIQQTGTDQFTVVGVSGSATTVNGKAEGIVFTGNGVRNFEIDLRGGNDTLGISNDLTYLDTLSAELAAGPGAPVTAAATTASALSLRGYANIRGGSGNDAIAVNLVAGGSILINAGAGADAVVVEGSTAASLLILADTGNSSTDAADYVRIRGVTTRSSIVLNSYGGDDTAVLADDTANVMVLDVGLGNDSLSAARLVTSADVLIFGGGGDDTLTVTDVDANFFLAVGGSGNDTMGFAYLDVNNASLLGSGGEDAITVDDTINAEDPMTPIVVDDTNNTQVTGLLLIDAGSENDTVKINGDATFNPQLGRLNIWTFGGNDAVSVSNVSLTGTAVIDGGTGDDSLAVAGMTTGGNVLIFAGTGNDAVTVSGVAAQFFLAVGGIGNDNMAFGGLRVANASLIGEGGNDTITVDDTTNALDPATPIVVDDTNNTQVTGLLHIDSGEGDDTVNINGDAAFHPTVGRLDVWTFGGIDTVSISNLSATGTIAIDLGEGNDTLTLDTVSTTGELNVFLKGGDDSVSATNVTADGGARARYFGGLGDDTFTDGGGNGVQGTDYFLIAIEHVL